MKRLHHICLTAHSEVLLRNIDDARLITNSIALSGFRQSCEILSDAVMSTHIHENVFCEDVSALVNSQIISITKWFNAVHGRRGQLFDSKPFVLDIVGSNHCQMSLNYNLRQPMHHGVTETAFEYPFSTCNFLFRKGRGCSDIVPSFKGESLKVFLPRNASFPDYWEADGNGIVLRNSFEQTAMVENWYGTVRNYLYSMTRRTSTEWIEAQKKDCSDTPLVTLDLIEKGFSENDIAKMLDNEGNAKFVHHDMTDMDVCRIIDNDLLGRYHTGSVYGLSSYQKSDISRILKNEFGIRSDKQISRCLAMNYSKG